MKRSSIFTLLAATLLAGCACSGKKSENSTQNQPEQTKIENVKVMTLATQRIGRNLDLSANAQAYEQVNLGPVSPGRIQKIYAEVSDRVKAGQLLIQMDETSLQQAKIQIANIEKDHQRYEALKESGAISQQVYDQSLSNLNIQKRNLAYLEENTQIRAPFNGVISAKNFEDNELYAGGAAILTLMQIDRLKAYIYVPESYYPMVKNGMEATVRSDIYPGKAFSAVVKNVAPTINPSSRTFEVELSIPNREELLKPGMFIRVSIDLDINDVIIVPSQAVLKLQGSNERYVFLNKNGVAERHTVKVGRRYDDQVELIADDIQEGDQMVVVGQGRLKDGVLLNIVE